MKTVQTFPTMPPALPRGHMLTVKPSTLRTYIVAARRWWKHMGVLSAILLQREGLLRVGQQEAASIRTCDLLTALEAFTCDVEETAKEERARVDKEYVKAELRVVPLD